MKKLIIAIICIAFAGAAAPKAAQPKSDDGDRRGEREASRKDGDKPAREHPRRRGGGWKISDEEEAELLAALKKHRPDHHHRLASLKEDHPMAYQWALRRAWRWYQQWKTLPDELKEITLDLQDYKLKAWRLARRVEQAENEDEKTKLEKQLHDTLTGQFQAEIAIYEHHIKDLEKRLECLREHLEQRKKQKNEIISDRMEKVIDAASRHDGDKLPGDHHRRREGPPDRDGPHDESHPDHPREHGEEHTETEEHSTDQPAE